LTVGETINRTSIYLDVVTGIQGVTNDHFFTKGAGLCRIQWRRFYNSDTLADRVAPGFACLSKISGITEGIRNIVFIAAGDATGTAISLTAAALVKSVVAGTGVLPCMTIARRGCTGKEPRILARTRIQACHHAAAEDSIIAGVVLAA